MRFTPPFIPTLFFTLLTGAVLPGAAAQPQIGPAAIVVNQVPSFTAEVSVDRDASGAGTPVYNVGDPITVAVRSSEAGYVYLFNVRAGGEVVQLLPNRLDAAGGDNTIAAGETKTFPPPGARYAFTVDGPDGLDRVTAVVSKTQLDTATLAQFGSGGLAQSTLSPEAFAESLSVVVTPLPTEAWVTDTASFQIGQAAAPTPTPPAAPAPVGTLNLTSSPSGAQVFIDDRPLGVTPLVAATTPGEHLVRIEYPGYLTYLGPVTVAPGSAPFHVNLSR